MNSWQAITVETGAVLTTLQPSYPTLAEFSAVVQFSTHWGENADNPVKYRGIVICKGPPLSDVLYGDLHGILYGVLLGS